MTPKKTLKGCHEKPGWLRTLLFIKNPSHRPDPNLGERKCGAAWGVTERQARVSERQTAFSLSLPGDYGKDEMFLSVSNSSRREFWAADERRGSIVEVPKRRKTKPIVSLSLPSRIFPAAILSFAREEKNILTLIFLGVFFFSTIGPYGNPIISECTPRPVSACAVWSYVCNDVDIFSTLASNLLIRRTWFTFCILLSPLFQACAARKWALPFCPWRIFIYEGSAYMIQCEFCRSSLFATFLTLKSRGIFAYYFFFLQARKIFPPAYWTDYHNHIAVICQIVLNCHR